MIALYDIEEVEKRIKEVLPLIIDEFTNLYGEKYRGKIEDRINTTKFVLYNNPFELKEGVKRALKDETLSLEQKEKLKDILEEAEAELQKKAEIDVEVTNLFLAEIAKLYPGKIKDASDMKNGYHTEGALYCSGIETAGCVTAFSKESMDVLRSNKKLQYQKRIIRENQIRYLRKKGIDIDDSNYDEVIQTEECKQVIPSEKEVLEIETLRESYMKEYYKRVVEEVAGYANVWDIYREDEVLSYQDAVNDVDNSLNCNFPVVNDGKLSNCLILSLQGILSGYRDVALIHELIHTVELNIGTDGIARCGLQEFELDRHTALNETKTQLLAIKIAERLQEKGIYFFESPENTKIKGGVTYEKEEVVIESFMSKFGEDILEVGMNGDMVGFLDKVGKSNFEKFSTMVDEHSSISRTQLVRAMNSNDPNHPITRKREQILRKVREALEQMEYEAFGSPSSMER